MTSKKLPLQQMKLACVMPLVLVSLTSCPPPVRAQLAESVSNPLDIARIYFAQLPKFPDNGAPTGRRRGGTSRDGCPALNTPLTALVPGEETLGELQGGASPKIISKSLLASTVAEYPTFWFYVPQLTTTARSGEFVLQNEAGDDVYRTPVTLPEKPGVISISLPMSPQYSLKTDNKYLWYFKVYCGAPKNTSEYFFVDGWVQRVALTRNLESQLKTAKPGGYMAYAANNIWYDALTNLADLLSTDSQNATLVEDWADLLKSVGLQDLAQAPIVQRYSQLPSRT